MKVEVDLLLRNSLIYLIQNLFLYYLPVKGLKFIYGFCGRGDVIICYSLFLGARHCIVVLKNAHGHLHLP